MLDGTGYDLRTDVPELYKPWSSTSSDHSTAVGTPLFICISRRGVVFHIDENLSGVFYHKQTLTQREIHKLSQGTLPEGDPDPMGLSEMRAKEATWKSIGGLALMVRYPVKNVTKFDDVLLIADTELQTIRCVPSLSSL